MPKIITLKQWKDRVHFINPHMYILNETLPRGTNEDPFICHCDDCGGTFPSTKGALCKAYNERKQGKKNIKWCPVCHGRLCIKGINDISTKRPDLLCYFDNIEDAYLNTEKSNDYVIVKCPKCNTKREITIYNLSLQGFKCNVCSDSISFPNKFCRCLLTQLPVDEYDFEYIINSNINKKYDGYFKYNNIKYLLEFDGAQHYRDTQWATYEEQSKNDEIKNQLAINNGYKIIRIDCRISDFEYIKKNIYSSLLSIIFDLDKIDWDKIFIDINSKLNYDICDYYMNNKNLTMTDIANHFHIHRRTLLNILKKMARLNKCDYTKENAMKNGHAIRINNEKNKKDIFIMEDQNGIKINEFATSRDCYEYICNVLNRSDISQRAINLSLYTGREYKGFKFKYKIGLYNHHKNNSLLFNICNEYNNTKKTPKELAEYLGVSVSCVYNNLHAGHNMKICYYPEVCSGYYKHYKQKGG